jgi:hypothetical protein
LSAFNILHLVPSSRLGSNEFELHDPVIAEYADLIWEPAYIDNVAMVTPVDPSLRSHMHKTRGDRTEDFTRRVETTLVFLGFLRTCEESFRDSSQLRPGVDPDEFRMSLTKLKIRSIWRGMSVAYRARLTSLKRGGYLKNVDAGWWSKTLNDHPLFLDIEKSDELLTPL